MARILFTDDCGFRFLAGVTSEATARTATITVKAVVADQVLSSITGKIFCQVITSSMDLSFISIDSISFMYHVCKGHAPIFMSTPSVISVVPIVPLSWEADATIARDANTCTK